MKNIVKTISFISIVACMLVSCEKNENGLYTRSSGTLTSDITILTDGRINHQQTDVTLDYIVENAEPLLSMQENELTITMHNIELEPSFSPVTLVAKGFMWMSNGNYHADEIIPTIDNAPTNYHKLTHFNFRLGRTTNYFYRNNSQYIFNIYRGEQIPEIKSYTLPITVYNMNDKEQAIVYTSEIVVEFGYVQGVNATIAIKNLRPYKDLTSIDIAATEFMSINTSYSDFGTPLYISYSQEVSQQSPYLIDRYNFDITMIDDKPYIELGWHLLGDDKPIPYIVIGEK